MRFTILEKIKSTLPKSQFYNCYYANKIKSNDLPWLFSKARFCTYDQLDYENVKIQQLKRRSDITITKPDKGSGVVLMDRAEYVRLLHDVSIKDYLNLFLSVKRNPNEKDALPNTITQVTGKGTTTLVSSAENTSQIYCRQDLRQWLTLSPSIWSA